MLSKRFLGRGMRALALVATLAGCGGGGGAAAGGTTSNTGTTAPSGSPSGGGTIPVISGTGPWPPAAQLSTGSTCVTGALTAPSGSTTYNVGPGLAYTDLSTVPWLSLKPGDVVNIYYRPQPYATVIAITAVGTAAAPIVINGVTDSNCNRPIISGQNARIAADAQSTGYWTGNPGSYFAGNGLINFAWAQGAGASAATEPQYIVLQNLEITGANSANSYTTPGGGTANWSSSYGIYAVDFAHVTIQNCLIHGNGGGVFFNSQDASRTSAYVTLRQNIIYGNGVSGSFLVHNIYGQGYRTLYEGNWLGQEISTAQGSTLKDRSSGTVIRYNYIVASARAIDLVDSETDPTVINDPLYNYAWIYGNIIVDDFALPLNSGDIIHWGGDSTVYQNYHNGTLYFYFNTMVVRNIPNSYTGVGVFDMPLSTESVEARSNIFDFTSNSDQWPIALGLCCGTINLDDTNWLTTGYVAQNTAWSASNGGTVVLHSNGTVLTGTDPGLSASFTPNAGAPVLGHGVLAPTSVPSSELSVQNLQPTAQFGTTAATVTSPGGNPTIVPRSSVTTLGAYQ